MTTPTARLALHNIRKTYPAVIANDGINLQVMPGEIHAVLGENGRHARSAVSAASLPFGVAVEIEGIFELS